MIIRLILFLLVSILSLGLALTYPSLEDVANAFINLGYFNIAILTGLSAFILTSENRRQLSVWIKRRESQVLVTCCLAVAAFLYSRDGGSFKINYDEQVLTNVSLNLHQYHLPVISESPLIGYSRLELLDKRPILFPFLLSLTHDIFGYSSSNGFYLNGVLTFFLLLLLATIVKRVSTFKVACISLLLAAFTPLISINSSGSGFDILNAVCILLVVLLAMEYWEDPTAKRLGHLALAGVLASQVRYESVLVAIPIATMVAIVWAKQKRIALPWIACIVPVFFIPLVWQQRAVAENPERYQYAVENGTVFSVDHLVPNLESAFKFLFIPSNFYPGSPFIGFLGAAGLLGILAFSLTRRKKIYDQQPNRVALLLFTLYLIPLSLIHAFFFYGKFEDPIVSRLALPLVLAFIIGGSLLIGKIQKKNQIAAYASYAFIFATALYATKQYANPRYKTTNSLHPRIEWALHFAEELPPGQYLFVSTMPLVFELEQYNAIHSSRLKLELDKLSKQQEFKTYRDIYVIENFMLHHEDEKLEATHLPHNDLGPAVELETVAEASFALYNFSRISRVKSINLDLIPAEGELEAPKQHREKSTQLRTPTAKETEIWKNALL